MKDFDGMATQFIIEEDKGLEFSTSERETDWGAAPTGQMSDQASDYSDVQAWKVKLASISTNYLIFFHLYLTGACRN
jgi:hypothetical protein